MHDYIKIYEVGARDGLQNEDRLIPTDQKKILVDKMIATGLRHIELTSFVHPKAVPQMADADDIMSTTLQKYSDRPDLNFIGLALNDRGYDRALAAGCNQIAIGVAVSETLSQKNSGMSNRAALDMSQRLLARAKQDGVWARVYIITAWVCPFEGPTNPDKVIAYTDEIMAAGVDELAIADTIGHAHPLEVGRLMERLGRRYGMDKLAVHLHDTLAMGLANATAALQAGVRIFDSSVGGLGGCPFAPGAAGNLATEDLVFAAYKMGIGTGVDFNKLWDAVYYAEEIVGRPVGGRIRPWWESTCDTAPIPMLP
ncbi:MAG TPA: hydroxymethylglutaryl-CoA lyase [Anaerolineae bacterium]|nr:hydroxymethylglutaryl-CoA lyase [Anaerolineae bacterium]